MNFQKTGLAVLGVLSISTAHIAGFLFSGPEGMLLFLDGRAISWFSSAFTISAFTSAFLSTIISWLSVAVVSELAWRVSIRYKAKKAWLRSISRRAVEQRLFFFAIAFFFSFSQIYYGSFWFIFLSRGFGLILLILISVGVLGFLTTLPVSFANRRILFGFPFSKFLRLTLKEDRWYFSVSIKLIILVWAALATSFVLGQEKFFARLVNSRTFVSGDPGALSYVVFSSSSGFFCFRGGRGRSLS